MAAWIGPAISAASSLLGGILGRGASDDASDFAARQFQFQNLAAKKSIQWRVKDARAAGIHPIYALGAQAFNPSPVSISGDDPMAQGVANMGQALGEAVTTGLSRPQSQAQALSQALSLDHQRLQNEFIRGQINAQKAAVATSIAGQANALDPDPENVRRVLGLSLTRDVNRNSAAQKHENEGGELAQWLWGTLGEIETVFSAISPEGARGHGINAGWRKSYYDRPPNWRSGLGGRNPRYNPAR